MRRVRRILNDLLQNKAVTFPILLNLGAEGLTEAFVRIEWDDKEVTHKDIIEWLEKEFPLEYWSSFISATKPVFFARFVFEKLERIEFISRRIRKADFANSVSTLVFYSNNLYSWPVETKLRDMVDNM